MSKALKDKLEEVELFVGKQLQDYTNEQVIEKSSQRIWFADVCRSCRRIVT
jgi:hypothetical protein